MAKRKESTADWVASLPWPAGLALGLVVFIGIQYGFGWMWGSSDNPYLAAFGKVAVSGVYRPLAWFALIVCWVQALASFLGRRKRRQLLESQSGMDSLRSMDWRTFELLVGEAFRRQGYVVEETGLGGADGGVDLRLRKDGATILVQCKQWRSRQVGVSVVREMFGILMDEGASAVKIVALGDYTADAARFAQGKPVELVNGHALLSTVKNIQASKEPEGTLDNPLAFIGGMLVCMVIALGLPSPSMEQPESTTAPGMRPVNSVVVPTVAPTMQRAPTPVAVPVQPVAPVNAKIYKAEPPMSDEELRAWEKKNREAMKILEKTTPELETPAPH